MVVAVCVSWIWLYISFALKFTCEELSLGVFLHFCAFYVDFTSSDSREIKKNLLWILMNSYDCYILSLPIVPAKSYKLALEVKTRCIVFRKYSKRTIWFYSKSLNFSELKQPSAFLIMFFLSDIFICIYFLSKQRSKRLQRHLQMTHWIKCKWTKRGLQKAKVLWIQENASNAKGNNKKAVIIVATKSLKGQVIK